MNAAQDATARSCIGNKHELFYVDSDSWMSKNITAGYRNSSGKSKVIDHDKLKKVAPIRKL